MRRFATKLFSLIVIAVFVVGSFVAEPEALPVANAADNIHQLDPLATDTAAHLLGTEYHGSDTPFVADFTGNGAEPLAGPVAGMDQWLTQQGVFDPALNINNRAALTGTKKYLIMRVYFKDTAASSYYGKDASDTSGTSCSGSTGCLSVEEDLLKPLNTLWKLTSYNKISISWDITDLYQLPENRDKYITDESGGDLSSGCADSATPTCKDKFTNAVEDAIKNIPNQSSYNFNDYDGVLVFMAETSTSQFHRGQAGPSNTSWNGYALPGVPAGTIYGTVVMSENPGKRARETYGRMGHEFGHAFQVAGPAHPSDYKNEFELMDSNYPGQTGAFEKQDHMAFPGWMPQSHYLTIKNAKGSQTDMTCIRALEYDPTSQPNMQVIKVEITPDVYYLLSVRNAILGDDLNDGTFPTYGIPTEGLLIERVDESRTDYDKKSDGTIVDEQIVDVIWPKNVGLNNRNQLWAKPVAPATFTLVDDTTTGNDVKSMLTNDDITFYIMPESATNPDKDYYCVRVQYGPAANQPDVSMRPWRESPGNRYETTDIWFDSPLNGYGTYKYGTWNDVWNNPVPRYNGDVPAVGAINRFYARVRNTGTQNATNVVVHFDVTDPSGVGIVGSEGWAEIASVDKNTFPALASIAPNSYVDVYVDWTPNITLTQEQIDAGEFQFHTCTRVRIDPVAGEKITGNQDGQMEQENIVWFDATPEPTPDLELVHAFNLYNTSRDVITYTLGLENQLPPGWEIVINNGNSYEPVDPQTSEIITVTIVPTGTAVIGSIFDVKVNAKFGVSLEDTLADPADIASRYHSGTIEQGGIDFNVNVVAPTDIACEAYGRGAYINVVGGLDGFEGIHQAGTPLRAYAQIYDNDRNPIPLDDRASADVGSNGVFRANFTAVNQDKDIPDAKFVRCIFPGTHLLASSMSDFVPIVNDLAPTPTAEPWAGSQFHFNLNLNEFITPPNTYSAQPNIVPLGVDIFRCMPNACPLPVGGRIGRGVAFNGDDTHLYSATAYRLSRTFSVAMWARRTRINETEILLSHGNNFDYGRLFTMGFTSDNHFTCNTYGENNSDGLLSQSLIQDTNWHHYVCAIEGRKMRIFVDGVLETEHSNALFYSYSELEPVVLGRRSDLENSFAGVIDDVRFYGQYMGNVSASALAQTDEAPLTTQKHLTFDDLNITHNGVSATCGGGGCPVVYYPDRAIDPRPEERIAAISMKSNRAIALSSRSGVARSTNSTLLFWARLDGSGTLAIEPIANGSSVGWDSTSQTLSYATMSYTWDVEDGDPSAWHLFAFVKSGNQLSIVIDGNVVMQDTGPALLLPFQVGSRRTLYVGNANGGEMAAIELHTNALSSDTIAERYGNGLPAANVTPTRSLTPSPTITPSLTPENTYTPTRTYSAKEFKQIYALQTKVAKQTSVAGTKQALVNQKENLLRTRTVGTGATKMAVEATKYWDGVNKTNTAIKIKTPTSNRVAIRFTSVKAPPTMTKAPPTPTASRTITPNLKYSATPTTTNTPLPTSTATSTDTPLPTSTWTPIPTRAREATLTPLPTSTDVPLPTNTAVARTATQAATSTPALFGVDTMSIDNLPPGMLQRALQHIADFDNSHGESSGFNIESIYLGSDATPFYRPDIDFGKTPAYYEIALYSDSKFTKPAGFIMLSNGDHDYPIAHWDTKGMAISKQVINGVKYDRYRPIKLWKLDTLSYAAEQNGGIIAQIGNIPTLINDLSEAEFIKYSDATNLHNYYWFPQDSRLYQGDLLSTDEKADGVPTTKGIEVHTGPDETELKALWSYDTITTMAWSTYQYRYRDAFAWHIANLKTEVSREWGIESRMYPKEHTYNIAIEEGQQRYFIMPERNLYRNASKVLVIGESDGSNAISVSEAQSMAGYPVLWIQAASGTANKQPAYLTMFSNENGAWVTHRITIRVIENKSTYSTDDVRLASRASARAWSSWRTYNTQGLEASQRSYNQFTTGLPCYSGCGPTAWMMLFGWADFLSNYGKTGATLSPGTQVWRRWASYRAGGVSSGDGYSTVAPSSLDTGVATAIVNLRNRVNTFCSFGSGATAPWDMDGASGYLREMGTGMGMTIRYNAVGYREDRLRDDAKNQIVNYQRPVVIGTGWLSHYPLAYRYKWRSRPENWDEGWFDGDDVVYQREFYVNQGWGGTGNGWISASTWFSGRISP